MVDSLKIFETLKEHLPETQARTVTRAIQLAETEIGTDLRDEIRALAATCATKADVSVAVAELRTEIASKFAETETRMIRWMFLFWIGQLAAMIALLKSGR
ncbi:MAG TPA: hypothetical protein VGL42_00455 [Opitutaceae bacterium]|jgi:hypothetical protein